MKVYFKPPEYDSQTKELVFPHTKDVPAHNGYSNDFKVKSEDDAKYFKLLQIDLMELVSQVGKYLSDLDNGGRAIIVYKGFTLNVKGRAKELGTPPYIFTFGLVIATPQGESDLNIYVHKNNEVCIECDYYGLSLLVFKNVVEKFDWKSKPRFDIRLYSKFRSIVKNTFRRPDWDWRNERAFNIPSEEYSSVAFDCC